MRNVLTTLDQTAASTAAKPIGVLILGRKRPGFDQEWNRTITGRCQATLESLGLACIGHDAAVVDDASMRAALSRMKSAGCDCLLMLQPSLGNGQLAMTLAQEWPDQIILWATPERRDSQTVSSCALVGQHLWASMLQQTGHSFELVYGDPADASLTRDLAQAIALARTVARLRRAKAGMIGTHAPGFLDLAVDPFLLRRSLGVQLHPLSLPQFIERAKCVDEAAVRQDVERVRQFGIAQTGVEECDLDVNSRYYLAMRDLMEEENLSLLSIQCWPELPDVLGQWPYLAVSRLTSEDRAVSIEGDVDGAIAQMIGLSLGVGPAFLTDWLEHDASTIFFWHPGMAPLTMCYPATDPRGPRLARHFNIIKPLVVDGELQAGRDVTIVRLWHSKGEYRLTAFEGRSIPPRRKITGNSLLVEIAGRGVPERFDALIHEGMPHHVLVYYGHCADQHRRLARQLGIGWVN